MGRKSRGPSLNIGKLTKMMEMDRNLRIQAENNQIREAFMTLGQSRVGSKYLLYTDASLVKASGLSASFRESVNVHSRVGWGALLFGRNPNGQVFSWMYSGSFTNTDREKVATNSGVAELAAICETLVKIPDKSIVHVLTDSKEAIKVLNNLYNSSLRNAIISLGRDYKLPKSPDAYKLSQVEESLCEDISSIPDADTKLVFNTSGARSPGDVLSRFLWTYRAAKHLSRLGVRVSHVTGHVTGQSADIFNSMVDKVAKIRARIGDNADVSSQMLDAVLQSLVDPNKEDIKTLLAQ